MSGPPSNRKAVISWCLYDVANSAFALTVMTAFFPLFFKQFWCTGVDSSVSTFRLGMGNTCAALCIALLSPWLGALADAGRKRKQILFLFMASGATASGLLAAIPHGAWAGALGVFALASIGFSCANLFYDSLLACVAARNRMDFVSSAGYAAGYLGSAALFMVNSFMASKPALFHLASGVQGVRASFVSVAVWWFAFSIPLFLYVADRDKSEGGSWSGEIFQNAVKQLRATIREIRSAPAVWLFLLAFWLYIDGVSTVIRMAADFGLSIGLSTPDLLRALFVVQLVAVPSSLLFGLAAQRFGSYATILVGIVMYIAVILCGSLFVNSGAHFMFFAVVSAVPLGGLLALSRSHFTRLIPGEKSAEYFGFYNLTGKFAVIVGPAMVGLVTLLSRTFGAGAHAASRSGFASIAVLFGAGGILFVVAHKAGRSGRA